MKKYTFLFFALFLSLFSFGQRKNDIVKEIGSYKKGLVSNASYDKEYSEIWNSIYIIANEEYTSISRESESKGYIEANVIKDLLKEYLTIEILGDKAPYRVSFQVKQEVRTKKEDGTYTNWQTTTPWTINQYYTKLQTRLYELLNGPIQLTADLQKKIDDFNTLQSKDRLKIIKGKDY